MEGTTVHPIWSVDRNDWIQLSELAEGERLQAADGIATVVSIAIVSTNVPVYHIEVHGEHVYQVGELGLLVHSSYIDFLKQQMTALHAANKVIKRRLDDAYKALDDLQSSLPTNAIDAMGFDIAPWGHTALLIIRPTKSLISPNTHCGGKKRGG